MHDGNFTRGCGYIQRSTPVLNEIETHFVVAATIDVSRETKAKDERLHCLDAEKHQRLLNRSAPITEGVVTRVY